MEFIGHYTSFPCTPVHSCIFPGVPVCSCVFSMHPNWPLLDIIFQLRAILCVPYGLESAFVVDFPIPCVLNVIGSNQPQSDIRYSYKWSLECPIFIFFMSSYRYLNSILYFKLFQLTLEGVIFEKLNHLLWGYSPILILGFQHQTSNPF